MFQTFANYVYTLDNWTEYLLSPVSQKTSTFLFFE